MYSLILDVTVVLLFLTFLFLASRQKDRYFEYHPHSWKALMLGGVLLVLAGGSNLITALSQGEVLLSLRWQQILGIMGVVGYLGGGTLVAFGLAAWCRSLVRIKNNAMRRLRQLACLKAISSVTEHRGELEVMLKESLSQLMNVMGYRIGLIYKPTFRSSEMALVAHAGVSAENLFVLYDLYQKSPAYRQARHSQKVTVITDARTLPEYGTVFSEREGITSSACVPIKCCGKVLGLLGLYETGGDRFSYQEIQFLTAVGEILGLAATRCLLSHRNKRRKDYISATENLLRTTQQADSLEKAFPRISTELKRTIEFDHFSLVSAGATGQNTKIMSMGDSGGILVERTADCGAGKEFIRKAMTSAEVRIDRNIDLSQSSEGALFRACGIKSRIILPLRCGSSVRGAVILGHKKPDFYSAGDVKWLGLLTLALSQLILQDRVQVELQKERSLCRSLRNFERGLAGDGQLGRLLREAASSLVQDLPRSFARVTLLSKEKNQLINCAVHQIRADGIDLRKETRFSLDRLPWHRLTLSARRPMVVNQDDPESLMSQQEARLIMDERINSAILVPVMLHDSPVGIISVGEMRNWGRQPLTEEEITFVKHKADQLSLALKEALLRRSNEHLNKRLRHLEGSIRTKEPLAPEQQLSDLSYQIANPLTSIRGSAELMRLREPDLSPNGLRYLRNIEDGVDRIQESLEAFLNSVASGKEALTGQSKEPALS